jgi:hypothetical protein
VFVEGEPRTFTKEREQEYYESFASFGHIQNVTQLSSGRLQRALSDLVRKGLIIEWAHRSHQGSYAEARLFAPSQVLRWALEPAEGSKTPRPRPGQGPRSSWKRIAADEM